MSGHEERPSAFPWPPVIYVAAIALAVVLHYLWPLPWFGMPFADFLFAVGIVLGLAAFALFAAAAGTMRKAGTTLSPHHGSDHLVTGGPFAFSRNPIYLADTMLMIAAGLVFGIVWFFILALVAALATQRLAIEGEERHLAHRFGKRYRDYQKRVRRWF
jgi:protein-S-isoprenylcysteine O-methyltransferase Ste14